MLLRLTLYAMITMLIYKTNCQYWNQSPKICSESDGSCNEEDEGNMCTCDCDRCIGPDHCCVLLCIQCNSIGSLYFIPYPYPVVLPPLPISTTTINNNTVENITLVTPTIMRTPALAEDRKMFVRLAQPVREFVKHRRLEKNYKDHGVNVPNEVYIKVEPSDEPKLRQILPI